MSKPSYTNIIDQINTAHSWNLSRIDFGESLKIYIVETKVGARISDEFFGEISPIEVQESSRQFVFDFVSPVAFQRTDESYHGPNHNCIFDGKHFREFKKSAYLEYARTHTFAESIQEKKLRHFSIYCGDDIVDIISFGEPTIAMVPES